MTDRICSVCGAAVEPNAAACPYCGAPIFPAEDAGKETGVQFVDPSIVPNKPTKKKKKLGLILGVAAGAVAAIFLLIVLIGALGTPDTPDVPVNHGSGTGTTNSAGKTDDGDKTPGGSPSGSSSSTGTDPRYPGIQARKGKWKTSSSSLGAAPSRTVMVYMVGSNLESEGGAASGDIAEMWDSISPSGSDRVLICTGGASEWHIEGLPADEVCYIEVVSNQAGLLEENGDLNMGLGKTLTDFVTYCMKNSDTDVYDLILWDHGGGPMFGFGYDERHPEPGTKYEDHLTLTELKSALQAAGLGGSKKLEVIGFDACLMGSIEVASACSAFADYMVASEDVEPGFGWNYAFLSSLSDCKGGDALGKTIVDAYMEDPKGQSLTLSCMDLSAVRDVEAAMTDLYADFNARFTDGGFRADVYALSKTKAFTNSNGTMYYDLYDLGHFAWLAQDFSPAAADLQQAVEKLVVYADGNVSPLSGVTFFRLFHLTDRVDSMDLSYEELGFCKTYADYQKTFTAEVIRKMNAQSEGIEDDSAEVRPSSVGHTLRLQVPESLAGIYSDATYYVVKKTEDGSYLLAFVGVDATLDEDGVLTADYTDKAVYSVNDKTGEVSEAPITMYQLRDGGYESFAYAPGMLWDFDALPHPVEYKIRMDGNSPAIAGISPSDTSDSMIPQKMTFEPEDFEIVEFSFSSRKPTENADGVLLPYIEWESTGDFYGERYFTRDGFHLEFRDIEDTSDYAMMAVLYDIYGNTYTTDLYELPNN